VQDDPQVKNKTVSCARNRNRALQAGAWSLGSERKLAFWKDSLMVPGSM